MQKIYVFVNQIYNENLNTKCLIFFELHQCSYLKNVMKIQFLVESLKRVFGELSRYGSAIDRSVQMSDCLFSHLGHPIQITERYWFTKQLFLVCFVGRKITFYFPFCPNDQKLLSIHPNSALYLLLQQTQIVLRLMDSSSLATYVVMLCIHRKKGDF